ncbi:putative acetyltransferase [Bacillus pakistanensis]|uniref:Acetyltransferase n=1 Tax=Rossellomorea pakistanensis TaxID=992288 RepID=A0ABS2NG19_9BACI|nr:GNAT family N-acetyltransferase [Bacillus pakistanensis]MBM7586699.1 putative acetyltransferase [Bacillus pakistanensis]
MKIEKLQSSDYKEIVDLSMYAFQYKVSEEGLKEKYEQFDQQYISGIKDEEKLAAKLQILSLKIWFNYEQWKMGGIASVATYPEYRRKGYVRALIKDSLEVMRKRGQFISLLHPFSISFYRQFGWEVFDYLKKVTVDKRELVRMENTEGKIYRYHKDDFPSELEEFYEKFAKRYNGMLVRESSWWKQRVITELTIAAYYGTSNTLEGYILYELKDKKMKVDEFIVTNDEARKGLWNFICQHDSMISEVELTLQEKDPLLFLFHNPMVKTEVYPYFMARIVDVEEFLKKLDLNLLRNKSICLEINDPFASWNNGFFLVTRKDVVKLDSQPRLHQDYVNMDVQTLIPLFFGVFTARELNSIGKIKGDLETIMILEEIVNPLNPFFIDFF